MHVLLLSTGYPSKYAPLDGIFYRDQAEALAQSFVKTGFLAVSPVSVLALAKKGPFCLGEKKFVRNNVTVFSKSYINIPKRPDYCINQSVLKGLPLFLKYKHAIGLPDIIHLHSFHAGLLAIKIKENFNIPFMVTEHASNFIKENLSPFQLTIATEVFSKSSYNIAVSKQFSKLLQNALNLPFHYVPNIVDTKFFMPGVKESQNFVFINVASLDYNKNHELLIKSFVSAFNAEDQVELRIIGHGNNYRLLDNKIRELKREHQIKLLGRLTRKQVKMQLSDANVFVLSSRHETFGVVLIEAISMGLPVISTKCGGPESIITNKDLGILCNQEPSDLAKAMKTVYSQINDYSRDKIRNHAITNFSGEAIVVRLTEIYREVINR